MMSLSKKNYSYKYNSNKVFGDPVASLSGKMLADMSTKNLLLVVFVDLSVNILSLCEASGSPNFFLML